MTRFFARLATYEATGSPFVLATIIETGGSTPRNAGARMAITPTDFTGTIGGGAFEKRVIDEARALLADPAREIHRLDVHLVRDLGMCCGGRMSVLLETIDPPPPLRIYGAGHIGTALAETARLAGFTVTVIDGRAEWADPTRFHPDITVCDADPEDHLRAHPPATTEAIVVVTHDHPLDEALIRALLPAPPPLPRPHRQPRQMGPLRQPLPRPRLRRRPTRPRPLPRRTRHRRPHPARDRHQHRRRTRRHPPRRPPLAEARSCRSARR